MLISLLEKIDSEKINKQIYFPFVKYIFSLLNLIKDPYLFKKKFKTVFLNIQFIDEKELFELLEDITDNSLSEHYCLTSVIKYYYSKMKEFYFKTFDSNEPDKEEKKFENIYKCEKYLKLIENLLEKLPFPKLIKQGLKTEINLFPLKIEIRRFLLNCETKQYSRSESQRMALNYGNKIGDDILFFYNEINQLSKINYLVKNEQKYL